MSLKLTKAEEQQLECICGMCEHTFLSKNCLYNKICDARDPNLEQKKQILKWTEAIVKKQKSVNSIITSKRKKRD